MNLKLQDLGKKLIFNKARLQAKFRLPVKKDKVKNRINYKTHPFPASSMISSSEVFDHNILTVKRSHITKLHVCLVAMLLTVIALGTVIIKLNNKSKEQLAENSRLQSRIADLKGKVDTAVNTVNMVNAEKLSSNTKAIGYIEDIQSKLKKINDYLSRRGLKAFSFKKPNVTNDKPDAEVKIYSNYNNYLSRLVENVAIMPMGYPRESSFTSFFGYRSNPFDFGNNEFHPGIDFKGKVGDLVKCTASGTVIFTGRAGGYGNCVRIKHTNSIQTWYGHLSHISVRKGQKVTVGEIIGKVGSTGRSTGPHLHYEVRENGRAVNPAKYLSLNQ